MNKFKIMIVDDVAIKRDIAQASLLLNASDKNVQHLDIIASIYDIERYKIVGEAIRDMGIFKPDLALIDVAFHELEYADIKEAGFDPNTEMGRLRGLDILKAIPEKCPECMAVVFSGMVGELDIYTQLEERGIINAAYFVPIYSKDVGLIQLSKHNRQQVALMVEQKLSRLDWDYLKEQCIKIDTMQEEEMLNLVIRSGETEYRAAHFFAYQAEFVGNQIIYPHLKETILELLSIPTESVDMHSKYVKLNGHWNKKEIRSAIDSFRESNYFDRDNRQIDLDAANYLLDALKAQRTMTNFNPVYFNPLGRYNVGMQSGVFGDSGWTSIFINALTMRRVILGLNQLAELEVFVPNKQAYEPNLKPFSTFFKICRLVGTYNVSNDNLKKILIKDFGLSKISFKHEPMRERLNTSSDYLLPEETSFLNEFIPLIQSRFDPNYKGDNPYFRDMQGQ
jgi:CheY-like chemotaxis protein